VADSSLYKQSLVGKKVADLVDQAAAILSANHRNGYTIPSARLYPFQWNWDAGFHALGWMYINEEKAYDEIISMFKGQWKNGMLPHIVFHEQNDAYFPGPAEWNIHSSAFAPDIPTSGITQLPVFGFVLERMMQVLEHQSIKVNAFLAYMYPKVLQWHRYLYTNRDPFQEGLVYIQHNWESTDNSPAWDNAFSKIDIKNAREISHLRKDTNSVDETHRPTNDNYKRYIYLVDLLKENGYDDKAIAATHPFLIQDILFNSLLVKSNKGLLKVGKKLGKDVSEIEQWIEKATAGINKKLWDKEEGFYYSYDLRNQELIRVKTSSGLMPLFAEICSPEQAKSLCSQVNTHFTLNNNWMLCPSIAVSEPTFDALKYWRGPVWANVNWLLYHGALKYGEEALAHRLKHNTFELIHRHGFFEYFDARPGIEDGEAGLGADAFSWTASVYLDWVFNETIL
jgi:hypothetical protein